MAESTSGGKSRGGRPSKGAGHDAVPVNVRIAAADHEALVHVAGELRVPGRPIPTVQDVLRRLVRGALSEPETLYRMVRSSGQ